MNRPFLARKWSMLDLICFKWGCLAFGLIVGGYFPDLMMAWRWPLTILFVVTYARVLYFVFIKKPE